MEAPKSYRELANWSRYYYFVNSKAAACLSKRIFGQLWLRKAGIYHSSGLFIWPTGSIERQLHFQKSIFINIIFIKLPFASKHSACYKALVGCPSRDGSPRGSFGRQRPRGWGRRLGERAAALWGPELAQPQTEDDLHWTLVEADHLC